MVKKSTNNFKGRDFGIINKIFDAKFNPITINWNRIYATNKLQEMRRSGKNETWEEIQSVLTFFRIKGKVNRLLVAGNSWLCKEVEKYNREQNKQICKKRKFAPRIAIDTDLKKYKCITEIITRLYEIIEHSFNAKATYNSKRLCLCWDKHVVRKWIAKLITIILNNYFYGYFLNFPFTVEQVRKRIKLYKS